MTETAASRSGVNIRLTDERWSHITEEHAELAGYKWDVLETISEPGRLLAGNAGELLALKKPSDGKKLWLSCIVRRLTTALSSLRF
jgi:hypothetical protein